VGYQIALLAGEARRECRVSSTTTRAVRYLAGQDIETTHGDTGALACELCRLPQEHTVVPALLDHRLGTPSLGTDRLVSAKLWDDNVLGWGSAHLWGERADPLY
jgi:hypothetical protein